MPGERRFTESRVFDVQVLQSIYLFESWHDGKLLCYVGLPLITFMYMYIHTHVPALNVNTTTLAFASKNKRIYKSIDNIRNWTQKDTTWALADLFFYLSIRVGVEPEQHRQTVGHITDAVELLVKEQILQQLSHEVQCCSTICILIINLEAKRLTGPISTAGTATMCFFCIYC